MMDLALAKPTPLHNKPIYIDLPTQGSIATDLLLEKALEGLDEVARSLNETQLGATFTTQPAAVPSKVLHAKSTKKEVARIKGIKRKAKEVIDETEETNSGLRRASR